MKIIKNKESKEMGYEDEKNLEKDEDKKALDDENDREGLNDRNDDVMMKGYSKGNNDYME